MTAELGQIALLLGLFTALYQGVFPLWGAAHGDVRLMAGARRAAFAQALSVGAAFALLVYAHASSDFSVRNVAENSHTAKPFLYKISGVWGNHEGSILLWALILALYGAALALRRPGGDRLAMRALSIQGLIGAGFLAFILFTSNPFARLSPAPPEGNDLNPLLQDPGLAFHPPFLYLGYVGFSVVFAYAIAGLIAGRLDRDWARAAQPFALTAWTFLTIGIGLGAWWAYYELGWGGFWSWDPVENASFMPWLAGAALIHSLRALAVRGVFPAWSAFLAILAFSLSLIGTFLVRSGVLTSVHAFAVDPARGVFILLLLGVTIGGSLLLFALRAPDLRSAGQYEPISRESGLLANNLFLVGGASVVFIGTFYPLFADIMAGDKLSVGPPYFNLAFLPFMALILAVIGPGSALAWRKGDLRSAFGRLRLAALAAFGAGIVMAALVWPRAGAAAMLGLALWTLLASLSELLRRISLWRAGRMKRARAIPANIWAMSLAHMGLAVAALGVLGAGAFPAERIGYVKPGGQVKIGAYELTLDRVRTRQGPNYQAVAGDFSVREQRRFLRVLSPERRFYPVRGLQTTEAAIWPRASGDLYLTIGERHPTQGYVVRVHVYPFADLMWLGVALIALGGAIGVGGMARLAPAGARAGAPARAPRAASRVPTPNEPVPAPAESVASS